MKPYSTTIRAYGIVTACLAVPAALGLLQCNTGPSVEPVDTTKAALGSDGGSGAGAPTVLSLQDETILGFEDASLWSASEGTVTSSANALQGRFSLAVTPGKHTAYTSAALSNLGPFRKVALSVWVPAPSADPDHDKARISLRVSVPSLHVVDAELGGDDVDKSDQGWTLHTFDVPESLQDKLEKGTYDDLTFTIVFETRGTPRQFLLDDMRLRRTARPWPTKPASATEVTAAQLKTLMANGQLVEVSPDQQAQASADLAAKNAAAQAALAPILAARPDLQTRLQAPPPAGVTVMPDGNWLSHMPDGQGGTKPVVLEGPDMRARTVVGATRRFSTLANQTRLYQSLYGIAPTACLAGLPDPSAIGSSTVDQVLALNRQIGACFRSTQGTFGKVAADHQGPVSGPEQGDPSPPTSGYYGDVGGCGNIVHNPNGIFATQTWSGKNYDTSVKQQGRRGSCESFAITAALEREAARNFFGAHFNLSEQDLYSQMKLHWDHDDLHDGFVTSDAFDDFEDTGYALPVEREWPYNQSPFRQDCLYQNGQGICDDTDSGATNTNIENNLQFYAFSCVPPTDSPAWFAGQSYTGPACSETTHQANLYWQDGNLWYEYPVGVGVIGLGGDQNFESVGLTDAIGLTGSGGVLGIGQFAQALSNAGFTIVLSFDVYQSFQNLGPTPNPGGGAPNVGGPAIWQGPMANDTDLGGHAIMVSGVVMNSNLPPGIPPGLGGGYFVLKNSWSQCWGDAGYGYMSFAGAEAVMNDIDAIRSTGPLVDASPTVFIDSPTQGQGYQIGGINTMQLQASTADLEDGPNVSSVAWTSDLQGPLGTGATIVSPTFTVVGLHTITATATDSEGRTGTATVQINVTAANVTPTIVVPTAGQTLPLGQPVQLSGYGTLGVASQVPCAQLLWTDSVPGEAINQTPTHGCVVPTSFITAGSHTLTLSVPGTSNSVAASTQVTFSVAASAAPFAAILSPVGTPANPVADVSGTAIPAFVGVVNNEPFTECADPTTCSQVQWTASACGGPVTSLGTGLLSQTTGQIQSQLSGFDPFSIASTSCTSVVVSYCVTDPNNPVPVCGTTNIELFWPTK
jgi:hypothetical protein